MERENVRDFGVIDSRQCGDGVSRVYRDHRDACICVGCGYLFVEFVKFLKIIHLLGGILFIGIFLFRVHGSLFMGI
jgi:hypothetical protein